MDKDLRLWREGVEQTVVGEEEGDDGLRRKKRRRMKLNVM